jgi:hypothetical protein
MILLARPEGFEPPTSDPKFDRRPSPTSTSNRFASFSVSRIRQTSAFSADVRPVGCQYIACDPDSPKPNGRGFGRRRGYADVRVTNSWIVFCHTD